jgi:hypothetical protein
MPIRGGLRGVVGCFSLLLQRRRCIPMISSPSADFRDSEFITTPNPTLFATSSDAHEYDLAFNTSQGLLHGVKFLKLCFVSTMGICGFLISDSAGVWGSPAVRKVRTREQRASDFLLPVELCVDVHGIIVPSRVQTCSAVHCCASQPAAQLL